MVAVALMGAALALQARPKALGTVRVAPVELAGTHITHIPTVYTHRARTAGLAGTQVDLQILIAIVAALDIIPIPVGLDVAGAVLVVIHQDVVVDVPIAHQVNIILLMDKVHVPCVRQVNLGQGRGKHPKLVRVRVA
jgi:hypothetical protein